MVIESMGEAARKAAKVMAKTKTEEKDHALDCLAALLIEQQDVILAANQGDLEAAKSAGLDSHLLDRLSLVGRLEGIAADVKAIAAYPDPIGEVFDEATLSNGLQIARHRTPIGVLGVIYEARPNVTVDVAALAIKTGNVAIMRGGKEALATNIALAEVIDEALMDSKLPQAAIQLVTSPSRAHVSTMLQAHGCIDLIIPRGGAGLHAFCRDNSTIPVITGGVGVCHLYVDEGVNFDEVIPLIINAKVQRPTVCNALDTLLVHRSIASTFLPRLAGEMTSSGVTFSCDSEAFTFLKSSSARHAEPKDWDTEWLSLVLGVKVVGDLDEAIAHIERHSSGHSDGILTPHAEHAARIVQELDTACVYVNASTRFTDGAQFGLGAEVAVSTQKLHARGPMGVREITSYKWVVRGQNHVRK